MLTLSLSPQTALESARIQFGLFWSIMMMIMMMGFCAHGICLPTFVHFGLTKFLQPHAAPPPLHTKVRPMSSVHPALADASGTSTPEALQKADRYFLSVFPLHQLSFLTFSSSYPLSPFRLGREFSFFFLGFDLARCCLSEAVLSFQSQTAQ
jgi:hypothetical protein